MSEIIEYYTMCRYKNEPYFHKINNYKFNILKKSPIHLKNILTFKKNENYEKTLNKNIFKMEILKNFMKIDMSKINEIKIILISELEKENLLIYINENVENSLINFEKTLKINIYFQISIGSYETKKKISSIIENLDNYWEKFSVMNINMSGSFNKKKFNLTKNLLTNKDKMLKLNLSEDECNYLNEIKKYEKENVIVEKNIYYINEWKEIDENKINEIFKLIPTQYMKYSFLVNLLCSKSYCHLVLKNKELLKNSEFIFTKYNLAFKYFIGYAWLTFICYENFTKNIKDDDIYIFDIDTAKELPIFPFTYEDINQNPYSCVLVDENLIKVKNNFLSVDLNENYKYYNGLTSCEEFSRRLNIFCNKKNVKGILNFVDWESCAITGSAICACSPNGYQLFDKILKKKNVYRNYNSKINEYNDYELEVYFDDEDTYKNSDIDLLCNKDNLFDFNDVVYELYLKIKKSNDKKHYEIKEENNNDETEKKNELEITVNKVCSGAFLLDDELLEIEYESLNKIIKKYILEDKNMSLDRTSMKDKIKKNLKNENIKKYFYDKYYLDFKKKLDKNYFERMEQKYSNIDLLFKNVCEIKCDIESFSVLMLDYEANLENTKNKNNCELILSKEEGNENKIIGKIVESSRYKICGKDFRTIEIFRSRNNNFMSTISKFHFSMVRGYWNGKTLKCMPSLISSRMNNLSHDYKYFASKTHPSKIIHKYRYGREHGVLINKNCRDEIILDMMINYDDFKGLDLELYKNEDNKKKENEKENLKKNVKNKVKNIFGLLHGNISKIKKFDECFNKIIIPKLGFMNKLKCIGSDGCVIPLNKKYSDIFFEQINANKNKINSNILLEENNNDKDTLKNKW